MLDSMGWTRANYKIKNNLHIIFKVFKQTSKWGFNHHFSFEDATKRPFTACSIA